MFEIDMHGDRVIVTPPTAERKFPEEIMGSAAYYPWVPDNEADWRLIAAAPELLEALKYARRFLSAKEHDTDFVDAVIGKATWGST